VLGDPDGASAAEGRQLLAEAVEDLIKTMVSV
jgi:creatinine amidohydrolase/Fe(II)-dependent formamide hydrolase-like protein